MPQTNLSKCVPTSGLMPTTAVETIYTRKHAHNTLDATKKACESNVPATITKLAQERMVQKKYHSLTPHSPAEMCTKLGFKKEFWKRAAQFSLDKAMDNAHNSLHGPFKITPHLVVMQDGIS